MKVSIPNFNSYEIYSTSYLYYGNDQARQIIVRENIDPDSKIIYTPCYHLGYEGTWEADKTFTIRGLLMKIISFQELDKKASADKP